MDFNPASRSRLTPLDLPRFPGDSLFDRLGRAVCEASCLPRKELFEAWEVARRVFRRFRTSKTGPGPVVDLAAGHGLLAWSMLLLDTGRGGAICVDKRQPKSFAKLQAVLEARWPRLADKARYVEGRIQDVELPEGSILLSVHACGPLTDRVLDRAVDDRSRVAVMPCCHSLERCDTGGLTGWLPGPIAIDAARVARMLEAGFEVHTATIPERITPENRLLMAWPRPRPTV